ncbi:MULTISPECIES: hypothetical protein [Paraburkholderia]|uniref:Helix-turn-helix domain-containing protein n=1 Tax=Paraburkholderia podalyriae TaxID=1938811 RepID=A0ABR7Q038_9BURK|nr:hypothetical protein [Paraburkholderia podalyriae]MBC8751901.1 helix-turn-helix domain-containing protein [Paraburkholderia podalyriae]
MNDAEMVSIEDAAKILFVRRSHVRRLMAEGKLSSTRDNCLLLDEVLAYKARQKAEASKFLDWHADEFGDEQP